MNKTRVSHLLLLILATLFFIEYVIRSKFNYFDFSSLFIAPYVLVLIVYIVVSRRKPSFIGYKPLALSVLIIAGATFLSPPVALALFKSNQNRILSMEYEEIQPGKKILLFNGLIPHYREIAPDLTIMLINVGGGIYTYNFRTKEWSIDA